jgi:hypothetical protein
LTKPKDHNWLPAFRHFLSLMTITSKENRVPGPINLYTGQEIFLEELRHGLDADIHFFVNLKARQLGISTVMLALDIFWLYMHPGLQGALIADTEANKETFRTTITEMLDGLPKGFRVPIKSHNRTALQLANGSRLQYISAGKGKNSGLGRSRGLSYVHASEISSWGDPKGLDSLIDALATDNPDRLYVFESTALGLNLYWDMWIHAQENPLAEKAFFIGWWAKELYRSPRGTPLFEEWWEKDPLYSPYEQMVTAKVAEDYGVEIDEEQWAWYRERAAGRSEQSMMEEFPGLPDEAWQATGSPFFNEKRVTADIKLIQASQVQFRGYRYELGDNFLKMKFIKAESIDDVTLRVWEPPKPNGVYVIGMDPAYGSSETADRLVISVWRCFADKMVQVAEYACNDTTTQHGAWVLAHLAGEYRDVMINLELQGGGDQVMNEIKYLKQSLQFGSLNEAARELKMEHALDSARWFMWRRVDNMGGMVSSWNFKTNVGLKYSGFCRFRDAYNLEQAIVRSIPLLDEMMTLVQDGDKLGAKGRRKDDRPFAAMLANFAWQEWIRPRMMGEQRTYAREMAEQQNREAVGGDVLSSIIPAHFKRMADQREEAELRRLLEGGL